MTLPAPGYVRAIAPYEGGKPIEETAREFGLDPATIVKLASNENPLGMPESARSAVAAELDEGARYPDGNGFALKAVLSRALGVPPAWITLGNGSNDILELAAHAFVQPGEATVYAQHAFIVYALATQAVGGRGIVVPARDHGHDLDAMAAAITPDTRVVFVANPNNPTGTFVDGASLARFVGQVRDDVVIVIDEAYGEYLPPSDRYDAIAWVRERPNLLVSRTFSKAYGLAGLRVGYGVAQPELTDLLNRIRQPFNVSSLAQAAAIAAFGDKDFIARSYRCNRDGLAQLGEAFTGLGLRFLPSKGNFVLVEVGEAGRIYRDLLARGVIVRPVAGYGLPRWLRVTVGTADENRIFIDALRAVISAAP